MRDSKSSGIREIACVRRGEGAEVKHGPEEVFDAQGLIAVGAYQDGLADGRWTMFHAKGLKAADGAFLRGVRQGAWTYWNDEGQVVERIHYWNGNAVSCELFRRDKFGTQWTERRELDADCERRAPQANRFTR